MSPVFCTTRHAPPDSYGDCIRACLATVLDVATETVPHFAHDGADPYTVLARARAWLSPQGETIFISQYPAVARDEMLQMMQENNPDSVYLLFGFTSGGTGHVVVCRGGEVVHNPAWHGGALVDGGPGWIVWVVGRV